MRNGRRIICLILVLATALCGCGPEASDEGEEIVLLDPVGDSSGWEAASRRNLYDADVYSATVYPYTQEYSFGAGVVFHSFGAYPGERVKKGGTLALGDSSALKEAIGEKEEQILRMEEEFQEYREETLEAMEKRAGEAEYLRGIVENLLETEPEEFLPAGSVSGGDAGVPKGNAPDAGASGDPVKNPAYIQWKEFYVRYEGDYRILAHQVDMTKAQLEQKTALYELDHQHALRQLESMKAELRKMTLASSMEGTVVAVGSWRNGSPVGERDKVAAVGDLSQKLLRCQYIDKLTVTRAKDVYALVDGKRYEIVYEPMDGEEYARRAALKETIYSTFRLTEDAQDISVGDFAVITVVNDIRENVLSVPETALHKEPGGSFVYVMRDWQSTAVSVETGMSDGVYREILGGIQEGDKVLAAQVMTAGESRASVERGNFNSKFSGNGYMTYLSVSKTRNSVNYGRTYFLEYAVSLYQHVEKGDVIARIRVQPDLVELERNQVKLARLRERLEILERQEAEEGGADKSLLKTIAARREEIAQAEELIAEMTADYATGRIVAQESGIIVSLADYVPEDILGRDAELAEIADEDTCYVILENKNQLLQYGNSVKVSYTDKSGEGAIVDGVVVNLSEGGLSSGLKSDYSLISLPPEAVGSVAAAVRSENGAIIRTALKVDGAIRHMNGVLVVPKEAVWESGGKTYVLVEEEGGVVARSFISGGHDASRYWVVDGLAEGMTLCLK